MRRSALGAQLQAAAAAALALAVLALAGPPAGAAPLGARAPRLWLSMEGLFGEPGAGTSRGGGAGLRLGLRLTDQLSMAGGFTTLFARRGPVTGLAAGFEATLDATPIAPFVELAIVRADPYERAGFSLGQRTGFGADYRINQGIAVGALVRYVTPLDPAVAMGGSGISGLEFGLRLVLVPGLL